MRGEEDIAGDVGNRRDSRRHVTGRDRGGLRGGRREPATHMYHHSVRWSK